MSRKIENTKENQEIKKCNIDGLTRKKYGKDFLPTLVKIIIVLYLIFILKSYFN